MTIPPLRRLCGALMDISSHDSEVSLIDFPFPRTTSPSSEGRTELAIHILVKGFHSSIDDLYGVSQSPWLALRTCAKTIHLDIFYSIPSLFISEQIFFINSSCPGEISISKPDPTSCVMRLKSCQQECWIRMTREFSGLKNFLFSYL